MNECLSHSSSHNAAKIAPYTTHSHAGAQVVMHFTSIHNYWFSRDEGGRGEEVHGVDACVEKAPWHSEE